MRRTTGCLTLILALVAAGAAHAEGFNNFLAGLNGVVTAPPEPVMHVIDPPETLRELPGGMWVARPLGLLTGTGQLIYQTMMGALDIAFTPFWVMPTLSPEARWQMFSDLEYGY